jgi:hypothetical protein
MVDALTEVHRALRPGAHMLDIRPSHRRRPRVEVDRRVVGRLAPGDLTQDLQADEALRRCVAEGLFQPLRSGHFWHRFSFTRRAGFDRWRRETTRFPRYSGQPLGPGAVTVRRAVEFTEYLRP